MPNPYRRSFDAVSTLISDAAIELGLASEPIADPYGSDSVPILQLLALLKSLGQDLQRSFDWSQLQTEGTFVTDGVNVFSLPDDFDRFCDETAWNRANVTQAAAIGAQDWQHLKARTATGLLSLQYRLQGSKIKVQPTSDTGNTVYYEYMTAYWVQSAASVVALTGPDKDAPTVATDLVWFDRRLIVTGLKSRWLQDRGYPAQAAETQYQAALSAAKTATPASPIDLTSGRAKLVMGSTPDTGWGL